MKKTRVRMVSLLLSGLLLVGLLPLTIYASDNSKLGKDLIEDLADMEMDDEIVISIGLKDKSSKEIDQMLLDETGMDADLIRNGKVSYDVDEYLAARRAIVKRECSAITEKFITKYLQDCYIVYAGSYTTTIIAEVTKEDVLTFSTLPEVNSMSSYKSDPVDVDPANDNLIMDAERDADLRDDYLKIVNNPIMNRKDVMVEYYGTYNGYDIVWVSMIDHEDTADIREIRLGNYSFVFYAGSASNRFFAYKDHQFIPIKEAYDTDLINDKDVREIARYFSAAYFVKGEDYYPVLKEPMEQKLKASYLEYRKEIQPNDSYIQDLTLDDVNFIGYYGKHNEWQIFEAITSEDIFPAAPLIDTLAGFEFTLDHGWYHIMAWKEGTMMMVYDAYKSGELSEDDILNIGVDRGDLPSKSSMKYEDVNWYNDWFADYAYKAYARGYMTGLDEETFGPYEVVSRAQFATMLERMDRNQTYYSEEPFEDVQKEDWYFYPVTWAYQKGVINGYSEDQFGPFDAITREQMAVMLYRYAEYKGYDRTNEGDISDYPDAATVSEFAKEAVSWCVAEGIISGNDGKLLPQGNTSRAECAAMISRFASRYE